MKEFERIPLPRLALSGMAPSRVKVIALLLGSLLLLPLLILSFYRFLPSPGDFSFSLQSASDTGLTVGNLAKDTKPIENLIEKIREAVRTAAHGANISFSAEDRKAWEDRNPCSSRAGLKALYEGRKHIKDVAVNEHWQAALDEYSVLHRVCMSKIPDLKEVFSAQNVSTGCKFLVAEGHYGLGNRLLHMSSLLVYAVLTQRVILIPRSTIVPSIVCEPFAGSSWSIENDLLDLVRSNRLKSGQLYEAMDLDRAKEQKLTTYASEGSDVWGPEIRFWCSTEQALFSKVTWLTFDGCLHFLPKLFAVPTFRPAMESLFPDRVVLTHVLRTVMLPIDPIWGRILQAKAAYLDNAAKQVGVQVRFLGGDNHYKTEKDYVNGKIMQCLWENHILPEVCPSETTSPTDKFANCSVSGRAASVTKVLISSLYLSFHDHINNLYLRHETATGEAISLVQLTHEDFQGSGMEVDSQALIEMITLSLSDILLVTPFSTFGSLAQSYGALVPYFIQYSRTADNNCERSLTTEPCYLPPGGVPDYECRYDAERTKPVAESVPYLQKCQHIDTGDRIGMLLLNRDGSQPVLT